MSLPSGGAGTLACSLLFGIAVPSRVLTQSTKPIDTREALGMHGFSVALVLGEMQGASTADTVPPGAKKALADMRGFLPYKSYRLLDTQWILCCGVVGLKPTSISGRLRGLDERAYSFTVILSGVLGPQLSVRFLMIDGGDPLGKKTASPKSITESLAAEEVTLQRRLAEAEQELTESRKAYGQGHASVKEREAKLEMTKHQLDDLQRGAGGAKGAVIDSTFSMDVGETVVIGTSTLKGERALIALLTAVQRPSVTR
jgi:hypothetical protein